MRIGMMADAYKPHVSGITNVIDLSKRFLEKQGHEVYVFTFGGEDYQDDEANIFRTSGVPLINTGYFVSIRYNSKAQKALRTMDLVHVHHPFTSGRLAMRYVKPRDIPIVFTNHTRYDLYAHAYVPMVPEALGEAFMRAYLPFFCKGCDLVIAPSKGLKQVLTNFGVASDIQVIPNGVDIKPFQNVEQPIPRHKLGFQPEDIILTYMGRIGPEKNLAFLLRAFAGVANTYDNVHLLIIGDGSERENLQDLVRIMGIGNRVNFTGMIPYTNLPAYMAVADAFVTASVSEVHPLSVIEALASGLPVIGIQSPGIGDTIEDGITGYLAQKEDLAEFTAKLSRIIVDDEQREDMSKQARQAARDYSYEKTTQILLDHYYELIEKFTNRKRGVLSRLTKPFTR
jgi:glycosyltransferase involved in cell wall biosynthesis